MSMVPLWNGCVRNYGDEVDTFIADAFSDPARHLLLVGGAGFDPRATCIPAKVAAAAAGRVKGVFFRERRGTASSDLRRAADANAARLATVVPGATLQEIRIFDTDGAVVGGRQIVEAMTKEFPASYSDVIVDVSALSMGIFFPLVRFLLDMARRAKFNLHVMIASDPALDAVLSREYSDRVAYPHSFQGALNVEALKERARLWLPQLAPSAGPALEMIFKAVQPHETCPIVPFPASGPRNADQMMGLFAEELEFVWHVDARDLVYASDRDPHDLYRTLCRVHEAREAVFKDTIGSTLVLSPVGSKALAIGALMAAIEHDMGVAYVEAVNFHCDALPARSDHYELAHLWLHPLPP